MGFQGCRIRVRVCAFVCGWMFDLGRGQLVEDASGTSLVAQWPSGSSTLPLQEMGVSSLVRDPVFCAVLPRPPKKEIFALCGPYQELYQTI